MPFPEPQVIFEGICKAIENGGHGWSGDNRWEATIQDYLAVLGRKQGLSVKASPKTKSKCGSNSSEWLVDFCLTEGEVGSADFRSVQLACEYENNTSAFEIRYDLQKLLVVRSPAKLYVGFAPQSDREAKRAFDVIHVAESACPVDESEVFLACIFSSANGTPEARQGAFAVGRCRVKQESRWNCLSPIFLRRIG